MSKATSFVAESSQNGSSGVAASSATTQSASAATSAPMQKANFLTICGPANHYIGLFVSLGKSFLAPREREIFVTDFGWAGG